MSGTQLSGTVAFTVENSEENGSQALGAEVSVFDAATGLIFVSAPDGVDAIDPASGTIVGAIDTAALGLVNSVAVHDGVLAIAAEADPKTDPGHVAVYDVSFSGGVFTATERYVATVGSQPDQVTFTADGATLLTANEGEPNSYGQADSVDPEGSVSIITVATGAVATAGFTAFNADKDALLAAGVRIFGPGASVAQDLEPEYIAVDPNDPTKAYVTLQENNAIGVLDIPSGTFTDILALGTKDNALPGNEISASDRDDVFAPANFPIQSLYLPDAIATVDIGGTTYLITANEGDARADWPGYNEEARVADLVLDPTAFPDAAALQEDEALGRLTVTTSMGDTDGDGDFDALYAFGGRSFSVWTTDGTQVFDSGNMLDTIIAETFPDYYDENRDDNKGVEPEGLKIGQVGEDTYLFVALERANAVLSFRIDGPDSFTYTGFYGSEDDEAPEVITFIPAADSPTGDAMLVTANEASETTTAYALSETFTLQILHASDFEGGVEAVERAPNFAAIVDALEDSVANSITLSSGDNFIPGPFTAAGTDPSVRDEIASFYEQLLGLDDGALAGIRNGTLPFNAADIAIMNAIGVQASTLGNHEFDLGPSALASAFDFTGGSANTIETITNIGAMFPYLSANLDVSAEGTLASLYTTLLQDASAYATTAADLADSAAIGAERGGAELAPWTTIEVNGETIGVLGATTQILESISTTGGVQVVGPDANDMDQLASVLQGYVDQMTAQGIDKIILSSHLQQYGLELELASKLTGVDIILAGGSHAIFADETDTLDAGDTASETYPVIVTGADGNAVAVVNTGANYEYVGRLVVTFDAEGHIIADSIDPAVSGAYVTTDEGVDAVAGDGDGVLSAEEEAAIFADGTRGGEVQQITDAIAEVIEAKDGNVFGYTEVFLEGRRNEVRTEETNLGNLSADANLAAAQAYQAANAGTETLPVLISIKNGGGIRAEIGEVAGQPVPQELPPQPDGAVSQLDIENSLRFNNELSLITLDAANLVMMVENALRGVSPGATPGSFPQISGLRFSFDATQDPGARLVNLVVVDGDGEIVDTIMLDGALQGDGTRDFRLVTLNFLAGGGDNYLGAADTVVGNEVTIQDRVDLVDHDAAATGTATFALDYTEQDAIAEYLADNHATAETAYDTLDTTPAGDGRIQNLAYREDDVIPAGIDLDGSPAGDVLVGGDGDDTLSGGGRGDSLVGGIGDDLLLGGIHRDTLDGGTGNDTLDGGSQRDLLFGGRGDDLLLGGDQADTLHGGEGADTLMGGNLHDQLYGGEGDDLLMGELAPDILFGGAGNDTLDGGGSSDTLSGGEGDDLMTGGAAPDLFIFGANGGDDIITDFRQADRIMLEDGITLSGFRIEDAGGGAALDLVLEFSDGATATLLDFNTATPETYFIA